jgi:uncharacterized protein YbaR (Trm112 family)
MLVVDRLTCPRCGPGFGLILLAEKVVDRRALAGTLGCPNCRDRFPVVDGFGDLRAPPRGPLPSDPEPFPAPDAQEALRLGALLGVNEGPAQVALVGPVAAHAEPLAEMVAELEVVAITAALREAPEGPGVSRMVARPGLPVRSGSLRGVALAGPGANNLLEEAARAVAPSGRVVLYGAAEGDRPRAEAAGLQVLIAQEGVLVAERRGPRTASTGVKLPVVG